jgi:hypothetical protein
MKYVITESRLERIAIKWLNDNYGDLERYEIKKHPDWVFFVKDGETIFDYHKKKHIVSTSDELWRFLESMFGLNKKEIEILTKKWITDYYNVKVRIIGNGGVISNLFWKDIHH